MTKAIDINIQRLFTLLRLALCDNSCKQDIFKNITAQDWLHIYDIALEQGVLAVVYDGIQKLDDSFTPEIETKIQWAYNVNHIEKIYSKQVAVATKLTKLFAEHDITTLILKGLSTASLYPIPSHRSSGDIDVYLMGKYDDANALATTMGKSVQCDYFVHSEFMFEGINIENHRYIVNPAVNRYASYIEQVLENMVADNSPHPTIENARISSAEFAILFYLRHASWHFARESVRLRDICDWAMILKQYSDSVAWSNLVQILEKANLTRFASIITSVTASVLGCDYTQLFSDKYEQLSARVLEDILSFQNPQKHKKIGFVRAFIEKIHNRISRKWCYDLVVPDSYWGNIWHSIKGYISNPQAIKRAKL